MTKCNLKWLICHHGNKNDYFFDIKQKLCQYKYFNGE